MSMKIKFERLAKILAPLMTGRPVEVTIRSNRAYTTGSRINIPAGDFTDPDFVTMAHGYIDHELGHNSFTDFSVSKIAKSEGKFLNKLRNALEDVRMEYLQGEAWPGAKLNLNALASLCVKRSNFPPVGQFNTPAEQVLYFCLYWGRFHINNQFALGPLADDAEKNLREQLGDDLVDKIMSELKLLVSAKSNQDCLDIARSILKLLEDGSSDDDSDGDSDDDSEDDSDDDSDGDSGGDSEDDSDGDSKGDSEGDIDSQGSGGFALTNKQFLKEVLESDESDDISDIHEVIAEKLGEMAEEAQEDGRDTDISGFSAVMPFTTHPVVGGSVNEASARAEGRRAFRAIRRVLIDSSMNSQSLARTGRRIAKRRLAAITAGAQSVFERRSVVKEPTAAISFVVDGSLSMAGEKIHLVNEVVFSLVTGLKQARIATQVTYYGIYDVSDVHGQERLYRAKSFKDKHVTVDNFAVAHGVSTPTAQAMAVEIIELVNRREDKKLLFVLTDGEPNCSKSVEAVRNKAEMAGVRVIPIGIKTSVVGGFDADSFKSIQNLADLSPAINHAIAAGLIA